MKTTTNSTYQENGKHFYLVRNLKDAGCGTPLIEKISALHDSGNLREELRLLAAQRCGLLEKVHATQKKVDCLDYLIFNVKQEKGTSSGR